MLRRITNIFTGFLFGLFPTAIAGVLAGVVFLATTLDIGIIVFSILEIGALYWGYRIYWKVQFIGPIEFLSGINQTNELEDLEPDENSDYTLHSPSEYADLVNRSAHLCKGGTLRLFGDWFGKPYQNPLMIRNAEYDEQEELLVIRFTGGEKLIIHNPKHIVEAGTYLKILRADSVEVKGFSSDLNKSSMVLNYLRIWLEGRRVEVLTSAPDKKIRFNVSGSAPALVMFGDPNNLEGIGLGTNGYIDDSVVDHADEFYL